MKIPLLIILSAGLMLTGTAQSREMSINARFSGNEHPTNVDTNADLTFASAGAFQVQGAAGKGVVHSFTEFTAFTPYGVPGCDFRGELVSQDFVETFQDGSMLFFMATDGHTCIDGATGKISGVLSGFVTGGTGRFAGATGSWDMEFTPYPLAGGMTAFTGTVTGTVELP